jgi:hypothetical protein
MPTKKKAELLANCATDDMKWLLDISSNPFRTTKVSKLALHETTSRTGSFEKIKERIEVLPLTIILLKYTLSSASLMLTVVPETESDNL